VVSRSVNPFLLAAAMMLSFPAFGETASNLVARIRRAHDDYDLKAFYDLSRRFLEEHAEHQAADTVRYDLAVQLVAENLKTPDSAEAKEAVELLRHASLHARGEDARFDAALLLLKFEPTTDPGKAASSMLARFARHPENGEIYAWAIAELEKRHRVEEAARWAKLLLEKDPKTPLADPCVRLIRRAELIGKAAPFAEKERAVVKELGGRLLLVDFFATWCVPCVESTPKLVDLLKRREQDGLRIVGIAMDDDKEKLVRFKRERGVPWPFILGSFGGDVDERFGVLELPSYVIVDLKTGKILETELTGDALLTRISALLDAR
jgi:thiol-disulfide isomerase/thioredoxin